MIRRSSPPERVSVSDVLRIATGAVSLVCGIVILTKLLSVGFSPAVVVAGIAFMAFGAYRLYTAAQRYQEYRLRSKGKV
ncbi:MAG: hypothetical protein M1343_04625 [Chloroflexi bacterium]|nr:hypothetical protein [Chloroflexota bacterium]